SNIDWDNNIITLRMKKTNKEIELPLLADVGNAIVEYLRNGRPKTNLKQVFLSCRAPYIAATGFLVSNAISKAICDSGINVNNKHHGPHSLRHTLASTLLKKNTTIPVISEVLGHKSTQTTMVYLKIDITSLLNCALPVSKVPEAFYMQKGGFFYE